MSIIVRHFVKDPKAFTALGQLKLEESEKEKLTQVITLLYHQKLLNRFLEKLQEEDKRLLIESVMSENHDTTIAFLREKIEDIEQVVSESIIEIEDQVLSDLNELKDKNDV